jgi:hypothetical protein
VPFPLKKAANTNVISNHPPRPSIEQGLRPEWMPQDQPANDLGEGDWGRGQARWLMEPVPPATTRVVEALVGDKALLGTGSKKLCPYPLEGQLTRMAHPINPLRQRQSIQQGRLPEWMPQDQPANDLNHSPTDTITSLIGHRHGPKPSGTGSASPAARLAKAQASIFCRYSAFSSPSSPEALCRRPLSAPYSRRLKFAPAPHFP